MNMHSMPTITFIAFGACFVALLIGVLLAVRLFKLLEKNYPLYYKLIGEPKVFGYTDSFGGYVERLKGAVFVYAMVFRGIPRDFPQDNRLRKSVQAIRFVFTAVIILFVALVILCYLYYKSGQ